MHSFTAINIGAILTMIVAHNVTHGPT